MWFWNVSSFCHFFFEIDFHYVAQARLRLSLLLQPSELWDHRCAPPSLATVIFAPHCSLTEVRTGRWILFLSPLHIPLVFLRESWTWLISFSCSVEKACIGMTVWTLSSGLCLWPWSHCALAFMVPWRCRRPFVISRTPGHGPPSSTCGLSFDCGWKLLRKLDNCLHLCMSEIIPFGSYVIKRRPQSPSGS